MVALKSILKKNNNKSSMVFKSFGLFFSLSLVSFQGVANVDQDVANVEEDVANVEGKATEVMEGELIQLIQEVTEGELEHDHYNVLQDISC